MPTPPAPRLRVGVDLVDVPSVAASIAAFGDRYLRRLFTAGELAYAAGSPPRLAARFAAKEAARKALDLDGGDWRDVEVIRTPSGAPELALHGAAAASAAARGVTDLAVSLSHEGDHATAVVIASIPNPPSPAP
jgi:holo-[acyl-carrier protein] synthase